MVDTLGVGKPFADALKEVLASFPFHFEPDKGELKVFYRGGLKTLKEKTLIVYGDVIRSSQAKLKLPPEALFRWKSEHDEFIWYTGQGISPKFFVGELYKDKQKEQAALISAVNINIAAFKLRQPLPEAKESAAGVAEVKWDDFSPQGVKRFSTIHGYKLNPELMKKRKNEAMFV